MGEFRAYLRAFGVSWERWACGALGFALSLGATFFDKQAEARMLMAAGAVVAFFVASYLVWRDEYRKTVDLPGITEERRRLFDLHVSQLERAEVHFLRRVVVNGEMPSSVLIVRSIANRTGFLVLDEERYRPNPTYRRLLEEWVTNSVDPTPQAIGRYPDRPRSP